MGSNIKSGAETLSRVADLISQQRRKKFVVGTAIMPYLLDDIDYEGIARENFNSIVCEHHQKWEPLLSKDESGKEIYDFSKADKVVRWARSCGKVVKGHTLVWHVTSPKWIESMSPVALRNALFEHIKKTVNHYYGQVDSWDVVNEPFSPDSSGQLFKNAFYEKLGPNYIEDCFRVAHQYDSNAKLILNENKAEGSNLPPPRSSKSDALYSLVEALVHRGVPIHEIGLQAHFNAAGTNLHRIPYPNAIRRNIQRFGALGVSTNISEMDVRTSRLIGLSLDERDSVASEVYHNVLTAALCEETFSGVTFWGFTDKHSWIHEFYHCEDRPLLWDANYSKKKAFYGVYSALDEYMSVLQRGSDCNFPFDSNYEDDWGKGWMVPNDEEIGINEDDVPDWSVSNVTS